MINMPELKTVEDKLYIDYINDHRKRVVTAAFSEGAEILKQLGIPEKRDELFARAKSHDITKYGEEEFEAYRDYFFPKPHTLKTDAIKQRFQTAWKHHYTHNDHHWESFLNSDGTPRPIPKIALAEMILDWQAMSMKFGGNPDIWYNKNKDKMVIHEESRFLLEHALKIIYSGIIWKVDK